VTEPPVRAKILGVSSSRLAYDRSGRLVAVVTRPGRDSGATLVLKGS
jgi:hypothetical protein